jgi:hypothetical protein
LWLALRTTALKRRLLTLESNWRFKSLEILEGENLAQVSKEQSSIVKRLCTLWKTPVYEFEVDDIRFMIGQGHGLKYMLIEAIALLEENLLTEGDYYQGDLLNAVLELNATQWGQFKEQWDKVDSLLQVQIEHLRTIRPKLEIDNFYNNRPT